MFNLNGQNNDFDGFRSPTTMYFDTNTNTNTIYKHLKTTLSLK